MTRVSRRLPLVILAVLLVLGLVLVFTADDDVSLTTTTTADGVVVEIPYGWVVSDEFDFRYEPDVEGVTVDSWSVAWVCPPDGCETRGLDEWLELAPELPTFAAARDDAMSRSLAEVEEEHDTRSWVLRGRTENDGRIVNVAVFVEGADRYLACNLAVLGDAGDLDEAIVDACRAAEPPG